MNNPYYSETFFFGVMIIIVVWTIPWKIVALWKAARQGQGVWFVVLLLLNTVAILEILYIFVFSKRNKNIAHSNSVKDNN